MVFIFQVCYEPEINQMDSAMIIIKNAGGKKFHGCRMLALDLKVGKPFFLLVHAQSFIDYKEFLASIFLTSAMDRYI